ncbi:MAG: metalloregulator ArsR/SmtB family transcription factor [bacterium]|nr:metalloregulator ArsR/SmtB family transcription factor [bacterium]
MVNANLWLQSYETRVKEKTLKALANKRRMGILKYLKERKQATVKEIAGAIKLSFKSTSRHLAILSATDILEKEQKSLNVFYRISNNQNHTADRIISLF